MPIITQEGSDNLSCNSSAQSYEWYLNGNKLTSSSQQIEASEEGLYQVKAIINGCSSALSSPYTYKKIATCLEQYSSLIKIYPNPASSLLYIELPGVMQGEISIHDAMGRSLLKRKIPSGRQMQEISLEGIQAGMYIIYIQTSRGSLSRKLSIK